MDDGLRVEQRGEAIYKEAKQVSWAHGLAQPNPRADLHAWPSHGPHWLGTTQSQIMPNIITDHSLTT